MAPDQPSAACQTRWFQAGGWIAGLALAALLWSALCTVPGVPWNAPRLAPSFALAQGLPIYALRDSGQHLGWFYGPVFPLWYLPITLTANPTAALVLAAAINAVTLLAPLVLVVAAAGVAGRRLLPVVAVLAGVWLMGHAVTHRGFYFVHVDVVCLAAGLTACVALHRATWRNGWSLHAAALAAVLAIWTKQIAVLLLPALFCWLWAERQRRLLWPFFFWCAVYGAVVTAAVFAWFGAPEVLFNTWFVHARNPWQGGFEILAIQLGRLVGAAWIWLPAVALVFALRRGVHGPALPPRAASLVRLLWWTAAWQLPLGLTASLKAGGGLNSVHSLHFVFAAGLVYAGHALTLPVPAGPSVRPIMLAWCAALALPLGHAFALTVENHAAWTIYRGQEHLLQIVRSHPGRYYLPWNPMITLIADRQIRPMDDALYCLWLVGLEPPVEKIRAAVPRDPIILYEEPAQSRFALRYFPPRPSRPSSPP